MSRLCWCWRSIAALSESCAVTSMTWTLSGCIPLSTALFLRMVVQGSAAIFPLMVERTCWSSSAHFQCPFEESSLGVTVPCLLLMYCVVWLTHMVIHWRKETSSWQFRRQHTGLYRQIDRNQHKPTALCEQCAVGQMDLHLIDEGRHDPQGAMCWSSSCNASARSSRRPCSTMTQSRERTSHCSASSSSSRCL